MMIRQAVRDDAGAMVALLNQIILIGGTTAHQDAFNPESMITYYIDGPKVICCHVAEQGGRIIGFQALDRNGDLADDWGDIGTFVAPDIQRSGAGQALFEATKVAARRTGLVVINATIRADNLPGLGYYGRRGFMDYAQDPDFCLKDGRKVGRLSKRFDLV